MPNFSIKQHLREKLDTERELSPEETRFVQSLIAKERWDNGEVDALTLEQKKEIELARPLIERVGTPYEEEILEGLDMGIERSNMTFKSPKEKAINAGKVHGAGILGSALSGDTLEAFEEATKNVFMGEDGFPDFDAFITDIKTRISTKDSERAAQAQNFDPEAFDSGKTQGELGVDLAIGSVGGGIAGKVAGAVAGPLLVGAGKLNKLKNIAKFTTVKTATGAGAAIPIEANKTRDPNRIIAAGITGGVADVALGTILKGGAPLVKQLSEKSLDAAYEMAFQAIKPWRRKLVRAVEQGAGSSKEIGRAMLDSGVIPSIGGKDFWRYIPIAPLGLLKRLDAKRVEIGKGLGSVRDEADNYADDMMDAIDRINFDHMAPEARREAFLLTNHFKESLKVDMTTAAARLRVIANQVPMESAGTTNAGIAKALHDRADVWDQSPRPFKSINEIKELKKDFFTPLEKRGQPGGPTAVKVQAEDFTTAVLRDEVDQAVARNLKYKHLIGTNPNADQIVEAFGENIIKIRELRKELIPGGSFSDIPSRVRNQFIEYFDNHQKLQQAYALFSDSQRLLVEKELAVKANNFFTLRDTLAASAASKFGNSGAVKAGIMLGVVAINKYIAGHGFALASTSTQALGKSLGNLSVMMGDTSMPLTNLANNPTVTAGLYLALTRQDSPLNLNGMMLIDDPQSFAEISDNISRDQKLTSTQKADFLNTLSREKLIKVFYKGEKKGEKPDVENFQRLQDDLKKSMPFDSIPNFERLPG
jgi:hypothetical protein